MFNEIKITTGEMAWRMLILLVILYSAIEVPLSFALKLPTNAAQLYIDGIFSTLMLGDLLYYIRERIKERNAVPSPEDNTPSLMSNIGVSEQREGVLTILIYSISIIPWDIICYFFALPGSEIFRALRSLRLIRVGKLISFVDYLPGLTKKIKVQVAILGSMLVIHFIACGWIVMNNFTGSDLATIYNKALYWTITTLTTIGYGDITPNSNLSRLYTMVIMILGVGVYGVVIGNVARLLSEADRYKESSREKLNDLATFMKHYQIPRKLQQSVYSYYNHLLTQHLSYNDTKIISELPNALQTELQTYMNIKLITGIPLFKFCKANSLKRISQNLEQKFYAPGKKIITKGEEGMEMFIIGHGTVEVIREDDGEVVATLGEGQFFGEKALLEQTTRNADVIARNYCDLYKLNRKDFLSIIEKHPELLEGIKATMTRRSNDHDDDDDQEEREES
ncbi:MAG: cyclic nucleotide-binding domain-containing protein [Bdellovibrionales bacterium]|nr:cyclic nucleotide-binding domain-containing protein [Bdellovibrionales bacterium]MBT3527295.1 cyclic nucleotide-binding domain-containing protein [Bdellovibrionales bacterium]